MHGQRARHDLAIAEMAARQHGVVSYRQLADAGLGKDAVRYRVRIGRLFLVHRGVYSIGYPIVSREGRWWAALLACGSSAVLSHRSAAVLWDLLHSRPGPIDVALPSRNGRRRRGGIRVHRPVSLPAEDRTHRHAIPVTTPARTIADLRRCLRPSELRKAIREAEAQGLATGVAHFQATRSELEHRFLALCARHGLPRPEINTRIGEWTVDFLWREERLIVETDGFRFHRGQVAFEDDRARDLRLRALGHTVVRLSYRQVVEAPGPTGAMLRTILAGARNSRTWRT